MKASAQDKRVRTFDNILHITVDVYGLDVVYVAIKLCEHQHW